MNGAGGRNRTCAADLEDRSSTVEQHPRTRSLYARFAIRESPRSGATESMPARSFTGGRRRTGAMRGDDRSDRTRPSATATCTERLFPFAPVRVAERRSRDRMARGPDCEARGEAGYETGRVIWSNERIGPILCVPKESSADALASATFVPAKVGRRRTMNPHLAKMSLTPRRPLPDRSDECTRNHGMA